LECWDLLGVECGVAMESLLEKRFHRGARQVSAAFAGLYVTWCGALIALVDHAGSALRRASVVVGLAVPGA
jgi:hypothetical protein